MERHGSDTRVPSTTASRYFEKLTKALPGSKAWSGIRARDFWPEGAKLVISVSLQFTAGAEPWENSSSSDFAPRQSVPDLHGRDYGFKEGIPRLLDIFQRRRVVVTSHMAAEAVEINPHLAREVVERGHEAAVYAKPARLSVMTPQQERASYEAELGMITRVTQTRPVGFHGGNGLAISAHTLEILQELDFLYHIDDVSRDEPFLIAARNKPFAVVPYTSALNDAIAFERRYFSTDQYACELKNEFEMLYTEAEQRRRMMSISVHDYVSGRPARAKVLEEFIIYAQRRPGVVFLRKDEVARFAMGSPITPREEATSQDLEAA